MANPSFRFAKTSSFYYFVLAIIMVVGILTRLFLINSQSLWIDEGYSIYFSDGSTIQDVLDRLNETWLSDRFRILYYLFLHYWRRVFGVSGLSLRIPSALFGIASIIVVYLSAFRNFGKSTATVSFLLMSLSSYCIYYSQEARDYSMLIFLIGLQLLFFLELICQDKKDNRLLYALFGVVTAINIFANIINVFFTLALFLAHFLVTRKFFLVLKVWLPAALFSSLPLWFYVNGVAGRSPDAIGVSRHGLSVFFNVAYSLSGLLSGTTFGPTLIDLKGSDKISIVLQNIPYLSLSLILVISVLALLTLVAWEAFRGQSKIAIAIRVLLLTLVFSFSFGVILAISTGMNWLPRHIYYIWPILAILIPSQLSQYWEKNISKKKTLNFLLKFVLIVFLVVNFISVRNLFFVAKYAKDDFRGAANYANEAIDESTTPVLVGGAGNNVLFDYYDSSETLDGHMVVWRTLNNEIELSKGMYDLTNGSQNVILIANRQHVIGPDDWIQNHMEPNYRLDKRVRSFQFFDIYHFELKE
ncbi:MAG: glycosyltransferase family 39 protein [Cyanobacteria bacterium P01_B01_bin.77]